MQNLKQRFKIIFGKIFKKNIKKVESSVIVENKVYHSDTLGRPVKVDYYYPSLPKSTKKYPFPFLIFNDGQDMEAVKLIECLTAAYQVRPFLVIAIHAGNRMQEYGTARQSDYAGRGASAKKYTNFIMNELLLKIRQKFFISERIEERAIAGFSLGALSAFDIAWNQAAVFGQVGAFSASFWWRSRAFKAEEPDADLIVRNMIDSDAIKTRSHLRFWLQTGTKDEEDDRNNNGIIDSIDDTLDVIRILKKRGIPTQQIKYVEVQDGIHAPSTWGEVLPDFLKWWLHL